MSLYGALFGGVSGLRAQSSKIGVLSDNIANVNTIGYKQGVAKFSSLVVNSNSAGSYQTGGVRGGTNLNISKQGLLQSTESGTDIAISGGGFFVVKAVATSEVASTPLYTRAGSFTQDALGNFVNGQGFFLQGWPLDREGRLPGEVGNLNTTSFTNFDSLTTVNVESASGVATATSQIDLGANLKAGETIFPGQSGTLKPDANNTENRNLPADAIIVGSEYGLAGANSTRRGDKFTVSTGNGLQYTYTYGGFTAGRNVTSVGANNNYGDRGVNNTALRDLDAQVNIEYGTGASFILDIPNHGLITGDKITLGGLAALGTTPAAQLNTTHTVTRLPDGRLQITVAADHNEAPGSNPAAPDAFTANTRVFKGNILDATSATESFLGRTTVAGFAATALSFTIENPTSGTVTFRYTTTAPNTLNGEFSNLDSLAKAIDSVTGLTARIVNGRLTVAGENASEAVVFRNGNDIGDGTSRGIDWVGELDLQDIDAGSRRFASLQGLANLAESDEGISASVTSPLSSASIDIRVDDPLDTITFNDPLAIPFNIPSAGTPIALTPGTYVGTPDTPVSVTMTITDPAIVASLTAGTSINIAGLPAGLGGLPGGLPNGGPYTIGTVDTLAGTYTVQIPVNQTVTVSGGPFAAGANAKATLAETGNFGSMLSQLGLVDSLNGAPYTAGATTGALGPQYDPTGSIGNNMASGRITAQFSRNVRVYDSLGSGHDVRFSFIKIATNTWAVEVHAIPESDITTSLPNGQIATGNITFNGDGTLRSVTASLTNPIEINWRNGSVPSTVSLNLGTAGQPFGTAGAATIGLANGLSQFDSGYNVNFANQNGAPVGQLVSVSITDDGTVIASYSNGETQALYKLPLADFANPDGLRALTGNVFTQTRESGEVNLREAGTNGTGSVVAAALEQSNVDLAEQLTDMIVAQRAYQANTKVIKTADELLEQLNQI